MKSILNKIKQINPSNEDVKPSKASQENKPDVNQANSATSNRIDTVILRNRIAEKLAKINNY